MAMPMGYTPGDVREDKADSLQDYKITCMNFIREISDDYKAWVDYYKLPPEEDARRRDGIDAVIPRTNEWIAKVAQSIKAVDVVMNDGIQKMAEATAGRPFQIGVFVNGRAGYATAKPGSGGCPGQGNRKERPQYQTGIPLPGQQVQGRVDLRCPRRRGRSGRRVREHGYPPVAARRRTRPPGTSYLSP